MDTTMLLMAAVSPYLVAFFRRCTWRKGLVEALAVVVIIALVTLGHALDGTLTWPLTKPFLEDLATYFGIQQGAYIFVLRGRDSIKALEDVGNKPAATTPDDVWRPEV